MTIAVKRKKLIDFIQQADDEKIEALHLLMLEKGKDKEIQDWWEDENLIVQLQEEVKNYEAGKSKGYTGGDIREALRKRRKGKGVSAAEM